MIDVDEIEPSVKKKKYKRVYKKGFQRR